MGQIPRHTIGRSGMLMRTAAVWATEWWRPKLKVDVVHMMLVGPTNSGKSTWARILMQERAYRDKLLIIDPHAEPDDWGGLPRIGAGRNYRAINEAFLWLDEELRYRYQRRAHRQDVGPDVTIFVDEYPVIAAECDDAPLAFKRIVREGRKVGMRLILLTQEANVKTLGIEGEGAVRENLSKVLLGSAARLAYPMIELGKWPAVFEHQGEAFNLETQAIPAWPMQEIPLDCWWDLESAVREVRGGAQVEADTSTEEIEGGGATERLHAAIRSALAAGLSRNQIVTLMRMNRNKGLAVIKQVEENGASDAT